MQSLLGLSVAQVLTLCNTAYSEVRMIDEPPGKLRAIQFDCHQGCSDQHLVLEIEYHSALFSAERSWASDLVKAQKVVRVLKSTRDLY